MSVMCSFADVAVFDRRARLLLSVRHTWPAEGSVWVTRRLSVLSELRWRLSNLDFPDHGEGVLQSVCVWRLCCGQEGDFGGPGIHWWHSVDPGWTRRTAAGLVHSTRGAVLIPSGVRTFSRCWMPQWLCVLFKADCQSKNIGWKIFLLWFW